jgi:hypothetical protein
VAAGGGHRIDCLLAQFVGNLPHLVRTQLAKILRSSDGVEKRGVTHWVNAFKVDRPEVAGPTEELTFRHTPNA